MKVTLANLLIVGAAGALGAICRYIGGLWLNTPAFPYGTLLINISGAFAIGLVTALAERHAAIPRPVALAITAGFLGAYTTFSALMLESDRLFHRSTILALVYLALSLILGLAAVRIGALAGSIFTAR